MDTVKSYFSQFPESTQQLLNELDTMVKSLAEGITTKISWDLPTYLLPNGKAIIRFGGFKKHIGLYPGPKAIEHYSKRLTELGLSYSKGAIQIPLDKPLPLELIKEIAVYNMKHAENGERVI